MRAASTRIAEIVLRHRTALLLGVVACAGIAAAGLPRLAFEFEPERLVAQPAAPADAAAPTLPEPEPPVLVVLVSDDMRAPQPLAYLHTLARFAQSQPGVERVDSLTTTPLPSPPAAGAPQNEDGSTLDDLEREDGAQDESFDVLFEEDARILATLASSSPEFFPTGLPSEVAERSGGPVTLEPLVAGSRPTPRERDAVMRTAMRSSLVRGNLISHDGRVALIAVTPSSAGRAHPGDAVVRTLERYLAAHPAPSGVSARLGGLPYLRTRIVETLRSDLGWLCLLAGLASVLLLWVGFRNRLGVLVPMSAVGLTLAIVTGAMAWLGQPITLLTNMVPPLLITIGLGDSVHLVARFREELRTQSGPHEAARRTLQSMIVACFLTSLTTATGFASLLVSRTPALGQFGAIAALAVMVAYAVTLAYMPAALVRAGSALRPRCEVTPRLNHAAERIEGCLARVAAWAMRRRGRVLVATLVIAGLSGWGAQRVRTDGSLLEQFDGDASITETTRMVERELGGYRTVLVELRSKQGPLTGPPAIEAAEQLAGWIQAQPGVLRVRSFTDWLREAWVRVTGTEAARTTPFRNAKQVGSVLSLVERSPGHPLANYLTADRSTARLTVQVADAGSETTAHLIQRIRSHLRTLPQFEARLGGEAVRASEGLARIAHDLILSLGIAVLVVFVMLTALFRDLRLGAVSIPPNLLPLLVTLGYMGLRGIPLHAPTAMVFAVCLGLAVDGTIHVLARFQEERSHSGEAVVRTLRTSGRALLLTAGTLLAGFTALMLSSFAPVRLFGELSAVAIGSSLLAELVLLPALLLPRRPGLSSALRRASHG